ncbi:MAG: hypothetical protein HGA24_06405 [Candidatus Aminicenantes bacterium]|nr:hypothetical protein [Candidatus Aminicenantes bacterium]
MSSSASASESARRARRAAAALALIYALAVRGPGALRAQDVPQAVVERIVVEVDGRPGEAGLLDLIPLRPGDPFQPALVDQAVKQIFRTGLFDDVRVKEAELDALGVHTAFFGAPATSRSLSVAWKVSWAKPASECVFWT